MIRVEAKTETQSIGIRFVKLGAIKLDQRAQPRDHLNTEKTAEYAEAMGLGDQFPPLVVFYDGADYWLADGFHRHYAALGCGKKDFACDVRQGGLRDAILYSVGANATHGYQRSNVDKRRAVLRLLEDAEWSAWSNREIAKQCNVSHVFVAKLRPSELDTGNVTSIDRTFTHPKTGKPTKMNTAAINADRPKPSPAAPVAPPVHSPFNMPPETKAAFDEETANSYIANRLWDIEKFIVDVLPAPEIAARKFPSRLRHTFSADQARVIRDWFDAFSIEFEKTQEVTHVAAQ